MTVAQGGCFCMGCPQMGMRPESAGNVYHLQLWGVKTRAVVAFVTPLEPDQRFGWRWLCVWLGSDKLSEETDWLMNILVWTQISAKRGAEWPIEGLASKSWMTKRNEKDDVTVLTLLWQQSYRHTAVSRDCAIDNEIRLIHGVPRTVEPIHK